MSVTATSPGQIDFDTEALRIVWKDGVEATYSLEMLRRNCPCAECRRVREDNPAQLVLGSRDVVLLSWSKMGFYGMKLHWSDGHQTGIFTYDHLREAFDQQADYPVRRAS